MFSSAVTLIFGLLLASGSPLVGAAVVEKRSDVPGLPSWNLLYTSYLNIDLETPRFISVPEGSRVNVDFRGGNFTAPDGSLLATIIPGIGGEHGYIDPEGFYHLTYRYTVQFNDSKYGFVESDGFGVPKTLQKVFTRIETDSEANSGLLTKIIYGNATFHGDWLVAPHWEPL